MNRTCTLSITALLLAAMVVTACGGNGKYDLKQRRVTRCIGKYAKAFPDKTANRKCEAAGAGRISDAGLIEQESAQAARPSLAECRDRFNAQAVELAHSSGSVSSLWALPTETTSPHTSTGVNTAPSSAIVFSAGGKCGVLPVTTFRASPYLEMTGGWMRQPTVKGLSINVAGSPMDVIDTLPSQFGIVDITGSGLGRFETAFGFTLGKSPRHSLPAGVDNPLEECVNAWNFDNYYHQVVASERGPGVVANMTRLPDLPSNPIYDWCVLTLMKRGAIIDQFKGGVGGMLGFEGTVSAYPDPSWTDYTSRNAVVNAKGSVALLNDVRGG